MPISQKAFNRTGKNCQCQKKIFQPDVLETDPTAEKSSKSWTKTMYRSSGLEKSLLSYSASKLIKTVQKGWLSSFEVFLGLNISATIDPINVVRKPIFISFMSSFHELLPFFECKQTIHLKFSFQWNTYVWSSHIVIQPKGENFRNAPNSNFDLQDKCLICTKFQAFTTFSATLFVPAVL